LPQTFLFWYNTNSTNEENMNSIFLPLGFMVLIAMLMMLNFIRCYKIASLDRALVIYGKVDPKNEVQFKVETNGGHFVWPVIQKHYYLNLDNYEFNSSKMYHDSEFEKINLGFEIMAAPSTNEKEMELIVEKFFNQTKEQISAQITKLLESKVNKEIKNIRYEKSNQKELIKLLSEVIQDELDELNFSDKRSINVFVDD